MTTNNWPPINADERRWETARAILLAMILALAAEAQTFREEQFHGRRAFVLENVQIRLATLPGGGFIGEVRFRSGDAKRTVNPLRVPHYPTIDPHAYDPAKHDALYGADAHRWLSAGYMGHFLCFPAFGGLSSKAEIAAGLGNHGEAPVVEWKMAGRPETGAFGVRLKYGADLVKQHYRVDRAITVPRNEAVVLVEEWAENLERFDRPVNWVQHATFGPPFAAPGKMMLEMSGTRGRAAGGAAETSTVRGGSEFHWPDGVDPEGRPIDLRLFQSKPKAGTYFAVLLDRGRKLGYFTMRNPDFPVLIGYLFRTADSPWVGDFQENRRMMQKPWTGEVVTRGIEFGTTPFAEGLRKSVEMGSLFGAPTYRWIEGRERVKVSYGMFLAEIPANFAGVEDVRLEGGQVVIVERGGRRIVVPASGLRALEE